MGVYDKESGELQDFGTYDSDEEAIQDFINYDLQKGRYAVIEGEYVDGEMRTKTDALRLLKKARVNKKSN